MLYFAAQYSFPYVKKRICVVKQRVQELSPIEVALDEMQMRVTELEEVVFMKPTDIKKLQLRLQVSIEVNAFIHSSAFSNLLRIVFSEYLYPICFTLYSANNNNNVSRGWGEGVILIHPRGLDVNIQPLYSRLSTRDEESHPTRGSSI
jgi:hypothetical protein